MATAMLRYSYIKQRSQFGKQCVFEITSDVAVENIMPDPTLMNDYILRSHNSRRVQNTVQLAGHEVQTTPKLSKNTGIFHIEGGWPKDINPNDGEATYRYRRRIEKSERWVPTLKHLMPAMEHCVLQNGAVNIYEKFFDDLVPTSVVTDYNIRNRSSYGDPEMIVRPVSSLSLSCCGSNRLAAAYAFPEFEEHSADVSPHSYIWDTGTRIFLMLFDDKPHTRSALFAMAPPNGMLFDPADSFRSVHAEIWYRSDQRRAIAAIFEARPKKECIEYSSKVVSILKSSCPIMTVEFSPRDPTLLIGGLLSGRVCCWDIRAGETPEQLSHPFYSHRHPVTQVVWIPSKVNSEFFSASTDGTVKWWDIRYPRKARDTLVMDLNNPSRGNIDEAIGVTALQYEYTMSSRFLAGLENGIIVNVNKKTNDPREKLASRFMGYKGPVIAIYRNPVFLKYFLTIGRECANVWADDTREGCLLSVWEREGLTGGCWSKSRCSVFFTINNKGEVKAYDILAGVRAPLTSITPCLNGLTAIDTHENGDLIAVGNRNGDVYMLECSDDLTRFSKTEKSRLSNYFERCTRYEKAVEIRLREIRPIFEQRAAKEQAAKRTPKVKTRRESKTKKKEPPTRRETDETMKRKAPKLKPKHGGRSSDRELDKSQEDYFQRIAAESARFTEIDQGDIEAARELLKSRIVTPVRKDEEEQAETEKQETKKDRRSVRRMLSRTRTRRGHRPAKKEAEEEVFEDAVSETTEATDRRRRSGKYLKKICEGVCVPRICCKDVEAELREKQLKESRRYKLTTKLPERIRSTLVEDRLFRKLTIQLDNIPELTRVEKRKRMILKNAAPNVLRKELEMAKAEVRIWQEKALAKKLASWMIEPKLEAKKKDVEEEKPEVQSIAEPSGDQVSRETLKQVTMSKQSIRGRRRLTKRRRTGEVVEPEEDTAEIERAELWKKLKKMVKEQEGERTEVTYPRISAAAARLSTLVPRKPEESDKKPE